MRQLPTHSCLRVVTTAMSLIWVMTLPSCSNDDAPTPPATTGTVKVSVIEYSPAPGQFVNEIPQYETGDTPETMKAKATEMLNNGELITLGAWGGSVTLKLERPIANAEGKADFRVLGNAYYADGNTGSLPRRGSAEPGIILVMKDENGNGLPDDTWYEIKGSETAQSQYPYTVTYQAPSTDTPLEQHISWTANDGSTGYIPRQNQYHNHSYYPQWLPERQITVSGRRLPDNSVLVGNTYQLICYDNGYADCHPNSSTASQIDIDRAVDARGQKVSLTDIDFIKVYTGVLQVNGWIGECSTEIAGIEAL